MIRSLKKIVIAPDSFKESLSSQEVCHAISRGIKKVYPKAKVISVPIGDGGEGTLTAIKESRPLKIKRVKVHDPLLRVCSATYGILEEENMGIVEMAQASGLELLSPKERNPWITSSFGTGELIRHALDDGCKKIVLTLGGVATNDAGVGMAKALGYKFLDKKGQEIGNGVGALKNLHKIDASQIHPRLKKVKFFAASDVTNPLCGPQGSAKVYGPQKGATPQMIPKMDAALKHFSKIVQREIRDRALFARTNRALSLISGAGAAGGAGAGAIAFLNAKLIKGINWMIELTQLENKVKGADILITGEGKIDAQTLFGKTLLGVARIGKKEGVPTIAFCGKIDWFPKKLYSEGLRAAYSIAGKSSSYEDSIKNAAIYLEKTVEEVLSHEKI